MQIYYPEIYQELENTIDNCIVKHANLLIVTLPGLGTTHLLQLYLSNHPQNNIKYIHSQNQNELSYYNIVDIDNLKNHFIDDIENYFKNANFDQKFAIIINQPSLLQSPAYLQSILPRRFHKTFYLGAHIDNENTEQNLINKYSAGIPRLTKFFNTNPELTKQNIENIIINPTLNNIISPTIQAIIKTNTQTLQKLNINLSHPIISHFLKNTPQTINIKVNFDLSFFENNVLNPNALNKIESQILHFMASNNGQISREKIAELKWGSSQYDDFSDLAITKTMRRLKQKLNIYTLKTIPKTGYAIVPRISSKTLS